MLNSFREKGVEVSFDEDGKPIVHRSCIRLRLPAWDGNIEEEIQQKVDVILENPTDEMLESVKDSTIKPNETVVVLSSDQINGEIFSLYSKMKKRLDKIGLPAKVTFGTGTRQNILKETVKNLSGTFFVWLKEGRTLSSHLIETFNVLIVDDLEQIILLRDRDTGENYGMNKAFSKAIFFGPLEDAETVIPEEYWWTR